MMTEQGNEWVRNFTNFFKTLIYYIVSMIWAEQTALGLTPIHLACPYFLFVLNLGFSYFFVLKFGC